MDCGLSLCPISREVGPWSSSLQHSEADGELLKGRHRGPQSPMAIRMMLLLSATTSVRSGA